MSTIPTVPLLERRAWRPCAGAIRDTGLDWTGTATVALANNLENAKSRLWARCIVSNRREGADNHPSSWADFVVAAVAGGSLICSSLSSPFLPE